MGGPTRATQKAAGQAQQGPGTDKEQMCVAEPQSRGAFQDYLHGLDEGGQSHGAPHEDPDAGHAPKKPKKDAMLDLSGIVTVGAIQAALNVLANEPGDRGELAFEIKLSARLGSAARVKVSAWGELKVSYSVNDQNYCVMAVDAAAAGRVGLDVAGWGVGLEVGYEKDFLNSWFKGSQPAAEWLLEQIRALNEAVGGDLIDFGDGKSGGHGDDHGDDHGGGPEWAIHEHTVSGGAYAEGKAGSFEGEVAGRLAKTHQEWHDDEHNVVKSTVDHKQIDASFEAKAFGKGPFFFEYHYDNSNTVGAPIYYTNGIFAEHTLSVGMSMFTLFGKHWGHKKPPSDGLQDLVLNGFAHVEKLMPFRWAGELNKKLFDSVVGEMYDAHPGDAKSDLRVHVEFNWNEYGESDGELNLMYFRVKVKPEQVLELGVDGSVAAVEMEASRSKSEVVFEKIGSDTVSYIQRQFIYETDDRPWSTFKQENQQEIYALVANCARPDFDYYEPSVEKAFDSGEGENHAAGLAALEAHWLKQKALTDGIRSDCAKIGSELADASSMLTWFDSTKQAHMDTIYSVMVPYAREPGTMKFMFDMLPNYAVELDTLTEYMNDYGHQATFARLKAIAKQAEQKPSS